MDLSSHGGEMPMPLSSKYVVGHGSVNVHNAPGNGPAEHHQFQPLSYSLAAKRPARYRECLKNHAAAIGGNATDGCGEFMPSGEDGSMEALKCSACGCHRNFHRKELEGGEIRERDSCFSPYEQQQPSYYPHLFKGRSKMVGHKGVLLSGDPYGGGYLPLPSHMVMPLGALQTSESEDMDGVLISRPPVFSGAKKRFRTKFTQEQKEKMLGFAEKAGWRLQKQEEGVVQQFCQEIGVKRRVLKVWMHNNKHNLFSRRNAGNGTAAGGGGGGSSNCTSDGSNPIPIPMQTDHV